MKMNYCALIIDIKKSKSYDIDTRNEVQEYLTKCIKMLNDANKQALTCDVTFSAGDELQGLFQNPFAAVLYWRILELMVHPVQLRAGLGVGEWNVRIEGGTSAEQDGPAYHNARTAIEEVYKKQFQNIRINSKSEKDVFANYLLNVSWGYKAGQNYMQNFLQLVSELLYPFAEEKRQAKNYWLEMLQLKESYGVKEKTYGRLIGRDQNNNVNFSNENMFIQDEIFITGHITEADEAVYRKGMNTRIADIMQRSRQNIDTVMKRGNAQLIRTMDYMALQYLKNNYGETYDS